MTYLFHDATCLEHNPTASHPEHPGRLVAAWSAISQRGLLDRCQMGRIIPATREQITEIHSEAMRSAVEKLASTGGGQLDPDTTVTSRSYDVACLAAGACIQAADAVLSGAAKNALCLIRPPGHHATPSRSMGFCLFNNIALAAAHARRQFHLDRILIVDWDVHHGNGTQDIFYDDPTVYFFSMHRFPFYPGSGSQSETGTGHGLGYTRNLPIDVDTPTQVILDRFRKALDDCIQAFPPQLVLISAGFDAHHLDPIGGLNLDTEQFLDLWNHVLGIANASCGGRIVSVLEGGYNVDVLAECVCQHLQALCDA